MRHLDAVLGVVVVVCIGRCRYAMCLFAASDGLGMGNARHRGVCGGDHPSTIVATRGVIAVSGVTSAHCHTGSRFFVTQCTHGVIVYGPIVVRDVFVCGIAADRFGCCITAHIGTNENVGDLATKVLYGQKRRYMVSQLLYDIYDDH